MFEHYFRHVVLGLETNLFWLLIAKKSQFYVQHSLDQFE